MKIRNYFYAILCGLALAAGFTSCSDDDDEWNPVAAGSNVEMAKTRGFILNEGMWGMNNAHINYFDYMTDNVLAQDLFQTQNGKQLGDVGQDIIEYHDNIYVSVNGSNYIAKLNEVGKELARVNFNEYPHLGSVRYLTASDGYVYATSYGGFVSKIDATTLTIVDSVKVGNNPEQIIEEDGIIYCVNSGWGYDNRLSIINEKTFKLTEHVELFNNLQQIVEVGGKLAIQGYGADYINNPVVIYDRATKKYNEIGVGSYIAEHHDVLYVTHTVSDWATNTYKTTFYSYDVKTGKKNEDVLKDIPDELANSNVYGININDKTGHIYILVSLSNQSDGIIYHFDANGKYVGKFTSGGQSPKKIIFVD